MRILHICSSLSREIGGPARSVQGLVAGLNGIGVESWLIALKPLGGPWIDGVKHFECAGKKSFWGVRSYIEDAIARIKPDVVHIQSIWMINMHQCAVACRRMGVPYVYSIRGALNPWALAQHSFKKKVSLATYQGYDFRRAAGLHVTSDEEEDAVSKVCPYATIYKCPNAVNTPGALPQWRNNVDGRRKLLFLSRVHESKGLSELVMAWAMVPIDVRNGWTLEVVGNDDHEYWPRMQRLINELGIADSIVYSGFVGDKGKWAKYRSANCFILPSHSENFGIAIAEALYAGLPVIASKCTPWEELNTRGCGWWVDLDVESLSHVIIKMMELSDGERWTMGIRGRRLIEESYTWEAVSARMKRFYCSVSEGKPK